ncbi:MATE family efflux transporter [Paludibacterium yongneupense]|uniref:MATE family efflux transporter n=1 Tax=Paludibacterium yongneupense TaxID=400061 RepID=UPI0003FFE35D|nr:MATE family efflux transporter [Paludibacterium yongneupense]
MPFDFHRAAPGRLSGEGKQLICLALPMMIAQIAQVATGFVDTVMSGRVSTGDLAAVSLGSSIFLTVYVTLMGVVTALNPILAHHVGANDHKRVGETARQGLVFGALIGLFGMLLMFALEPLLASVLNLPPDVEAKIMLFISGSALAMPAAMIHRALHALASSLNRPRPIMLVSLCALGLNIPLNYILIHGLFGLPRMGGAGCGWATAAAFWFNSIALWVYMAASPAFARYRLSARLPRPDFAMHRTFLRLGLPIALSFFVEISLFSFIALLIARLGTVVVASHQAVLNFSSLIYMVPQSISTALSVRVGQSIGAGDPQGARMICGVGLCLGLATALCTMLAILFGRHAIISMYTSDPQLIAMGSTLLIFAAVYQLTDAAQTIASGALRGYKLTRIPMAIHIVSFWGAGLGLGIVLGMTDWVVSPALGIYGFWSALVISLSAAAALLVAYLVRESRRRIPLDLAKGQTT